MTTSIQAGLSRPVEPLQIPYPRGFAGARTNPEAQQIMVTTGLSVFTSDEIGVINDYLRGLPYRQDLVFGAVFIDPADPLLNVSHDELDTIEASIQVPNSRQSPGGGERSVRERVVILREDHKYFGNNGVALLEPAI